MRMLALRRLKDGVRELSTERPREYPFHLLTAAVMPELDPVRKLFGSVVRDGRPGHR